MCARFLIYTTKHVGMSHVSTFNDVIHVTNIIKKVNTIPFFIVCIYFLFKLVILIILIVKQNSFDKILMCSYVKIT